MITLFTQRIIGAVVGTVLVSACFAQTLVVETRIPTDFSACSEVGYTLEVTNPSNQPSAAGTLQYCLLPGLLFAGATGITVADTTDLRCPVLTLPALAPQEKLMFELRVRVGCFSKDVADQRDTLRITLDGMPQPLVLSSAYNVRTPLITLTPEMNWSFTGPSDTVFTRTFRLRNEGLGNVYRIFVVDPYGQAGLTLLQTTGTFSGDTLVLTGTDLGPNGFLAFRESVVVTQTFRLGNCSAAGNTVAYGWSCADGIPCAAPRLLQYEIVSTSIEQQALVEIRFDMPFMSPPPCEQTTVVLSLENKGQISALNLEWALGIISLPTLSAAKGTKGDSCYRITQFRVGNTPLLDTTGGAPLKPYWFLFSALTTDPDGPDGLSDADGDGQFDDLAPGEKAMLSFVFSLDPSCKLCNQSLPEQYIAASAYFTNACNQWQVSHVKTKPGIGISFDSSALSIEQEFILLADSIFEFRYDVDAVFSGLSELCPNDSLIMEISLPITLALPPIFSPEMEGQPLPWWQSSDTTLTLLLPSSRGRLTLPLRVVCPPDIDNTSVCGNCYDPRVYNMSARVYWRCGNGCSQVYELACMDDLVFTVDCPRPQDTSQKHGLFADAFLVQRLSLGYVDNFLSARVSPQPGLQLDVALPFDTVLMVAFGHVEGLPGEAFDSSELEIYYWNGAAPYFQHLFTRIIVEDVETGALVSCEGLGPVYQYINGYHVWTFDLLPLSEPGGCLADAGVRITAGDRIRAEVSAFTTLSLPSNGVEVLKDLRVRFPYYYDGGRMLCKTANAAFRGINPQYDVKLSATLEDGVCGHLLLDVSLVQGIPNRVSTDLFPGEIRPLFVYDTLTIEMLPGYAYVSGSSRWSYREGDGAQGEPPLASLALADPVMIPLPNSSTLLQYVRPAGLPVTDYYKGGALSSLSISLDVLCPLDTAAFPVRVVGNSYYSLYDTLSAFYNGTFGHFESVDKTQLTTLNPVSNLREPSWRVRLCAPQDNMAIPEPILFFENNADMPLLSVQRVTSTDTSALAIEVGPAGQSLVRLPALGRSQCIELIVRAMSPSDCQSDTLHLRVGFQCAGQSEPCLLKQDLELYFRAQNALPQIIAFGPSSPVALCSPVPYEIYLVNQGEGPMYDIAIQVHLPEIGQAYVPGSLSVEYEGVAVSLPDPQVTPEGLYIAVDLAQLPLPIEALPGLSASPRNLLVFRFNVVTDCNYLDAAYIRYGAAWQNACVGVEKKTSFFAAPKMAILGAPTQTNNYLIALTAPKPATHCGRIPLRVRITNPGNLGPTQSNEKVRLMLPESFQYVPGSLQAVRHGPVAEPAVVAAGAHRFLTFALSEGVGAGDSIVFSLEVRQTVPSATCAEMYPVLVQMLQAVDLPCGTLSCAVDFTMLEDSAFLSLEKPVYQFVGLDGVATSASAHLERWELHVRVQNVSTIIGGGLLTLQVRLDADQDGQLDPTDSLLTSFAIPTDGLLPGAVSGFDFAAEVSAAQGCSGLWVVLADTACACQPDTVYLPFVRLRNAGQDQTLCAGQIAHLGAEPLTGATYSWSPASASLSNGTIADPTYRYLGPFDASLQHQEQLVLQTTRAQGCTSFDTVRLLVRKVEASLTAVPVSCAGDSTGVLIASVQGALLPVQFLWDTGASPDSQLTQLPAGTYGLIVLDSLGCTDTLTAVVEEPAPLSVQLTALEHNGFGVSCAGATDGAINAVAAGGVLPYTYTWSPTGSGPNPANLPPGVYALTLTDANNCTTIAAVELTEPMPLLLSLALEDEHCIGGANGRIDVLVSGGVAPYRVNDQPPGGVAQQLSGLSGGAHTVVVIDANGCSVSADAVLQTLTSQVSVRADSADCFGGRGSAEVLASGYPPFAYQWSDNTAAAGIVVQAGVYTVTVSDVLGCTYVLQVEIAQPPLLVGQALARPVRCFGGSDGRIELAAQGGSAPYQFVQGGQPVTSPLTGLVVGVYTFVLTDAKGCTALLSTSVTQPDSLLVTLSVADVRCFGENSGGVVAQPSGGVPPYNYVWSSGSSIASAQNLAAGDYTLTLTDANGCTLQTDVEVREPAPYEPTFEVERQPCADRANGLLSVSGFPPGTRYGLNRTPNSDVPRFNGIGGGPLTLNVVDSAGCRFAYSFSMPTLPALLGDVFADTTIWLGDSAWLRVAIPPLASASGAVRFHWVNPTAVLSGCDTCTELWVRPLRTTPYVVAFTTENGCRSEARVLVSVVRDDVYAPNAFHPEAPWPENRYFTLYARPGLLRQIRVLRIYSRWGELVFERYAFSPNVFSEGWDGYHNGQPLNPAVFAWYAEVEYLDGWVELLKGDVTLIR